MIGVGAQLESLQRQHEREVRKLEERAKSIMLAGAKHAMRRGVRQAMHLTAKADLVDRRYFLFGWDWNSTPTGAIMGNSAPHATEIEIGRQPGNRPDYNDILGWVNRKLVGRGYISPESAPDVAMNVTNAIYANGLPAHYMLRGMLSQIAGWAMQYQVKKMNREPGWKKRRDRWRLEIR